MRHQSRQARSRRGDTRFRVGRLPAGGLRVWKGLGQIGLEPSRFRAERSTTIFIPHRWGIENKNCRSTGESLSSRSNGEEAAKLVLAKRPGLEGVQRTVAEVRASRRVLNPYGPPGLRLRICSMRAGGDVRFSSPRARHPLLQGHDHRHSTSVHFDGTHRTGGLIRR